LNDSPNYCGEARNKPAAKGELELGLWQPSTPDDCAICGLGPADGVKMSSIGWGLQIRCGRCGVYVLRNEEVFFRPPPGYEAWFACATRQNWEETGKAMVVKADETIFRLTAKHREANVNENLRLLLQYIGKKIRRPSEALVIQQHIDFPVIDVDTPADFAVCLTWLVQEGLIADSSSGNSHNVSLTRSGWERLQPTRQQGGAPGTCFIAMWFDPLMNEPYELGIAAAVRDSGFTAVRIDRKEHNNQITDEIMAAIRGSEFMVADFTGHRAGVYYEAGFARGLGREVIYCCREDAFKERHFDTSVINHVVWTDPADLQRKLADRIRATILPKV
jgi:hypothetical protein